MFANKGALAKSSNSRNYSYVSCKKKKKNSINARNFTSIAFAFLPQDSHILLIV